MRDKWGRNADLWRVLRVIGGGVSLFWAAGVASVGIEQALDPAYDWHWFADPFAAGAMLLPSALFWAWQARRIWRRRARSPADAPAASEPAAPTATGTRDEFEGLPAATLDEWRRLEHARDLVLGFADDGWIERSALLHVDDHMARLRRLLEADARVEQVGGAPSATLQGRVAELRALLVALADAAVEHQASLASDDPAPVTLTEARDRLATSTQAYRELGRPTEVRRLQQPG